MVATLAKAASADYYVHSQASHRPPDDYYTSGEEPDGVWFNPTDLLGGPDSAMYNGATIDSADFYKLYRGLHPKTGEKLTRNADSEKRCPAYDMTFNADKTVSALWAIAPPEVRAQIERAHNDAVRVSLQDTIAAHCSHTRIRNEDGDLEVVPADIMAASSSTAPPARTTRIFTPIASFLTSPAPTTTADGERSTAPRYSNGSRPPGPPTAPSSHGYSVNAWASNSRPTARKTNSPASPASPRNY